MSVEGRVETEGVDNQAFVEQEERVAKYPLIGMLGPTGAGKSTLSNLIATQWSLPDYDIGVFEEKYGENPHLVPFYEDPAGGHSLSSQLFFLQSKTEQLADVHEMNQDRAVIIDPALEMDSIFAQAQHRMGWMTDEEFGEYTTTYQSLIDQHNIPDPDIIVVVNARPDVLRERIKERGRDFELGLLEKYPEYIEVLHELVKSFYWDEKQIKVHIDSGKMDFVNNIRGRFEAVEKVVNFVDYGVRRSDDDCPSLILPKLD